MTAGRKNLPNFCNICVILFNSQIKMPAVMLRAAGQAECRQNTGRMRAACRGQPGDGGTF